jgi:transcriptional regulator with GAF, ATPase, and Fis domain
MIDMHGLFSTVQEPGRALNQIDTKGHLKSTPAPESADVDPICDALLSDAFNLEEFEARLLRTAMKKVDGNVSKAARVLGLTRAQLAYRLEKKDS